MTIYKTKGIRGNWFIGNTFAILINDYRPDMDAGLFLGTRMCNHPLAEIHNYGEIYFDEEVCNFDEFEEVPFELE